MNKRKSFWKTEIVIPLRWIAYLPVGFCLTILLQAIPPLIAGLAKAHMPESIFLITLLAVIAVPSLIVFGLLWIVGVLAMPQLNCGFIAPSKRVAVIIYGMLFCLFEGSFLISILTGGASWIFLIYQFVFSVITVSGIVMVYKETDPVRTALTGIRKLRPRTLSI
jgi:hypothetical protein